MPGAAFDSTTGSYIAFAAIKLAGYTASAVFFNRYFPSAPANPFVFGLVRTILGMSLGAVAGLIGLVYLDLVFIFFLVGLIPFRIAEWSLTLWFFYRRDPSFKEHYANNVAYGIVWSFGLDIPAIIGFIATGGFWIC